MATKNNQKFYEAYAKFYRENKRPKTIPQTCPECESTNLNWCPGGTCLYPTNGVWFICADCLNEWG